MALRQIRFAVDLLAEGSAQDKADSRLVMRYLLEVLAKYDLLYLQRRPETPKLRGSGVVYIRDDFPNNLESWKGIPEILRDGKADCKSLAAWRCAELRLQGKAVKMGLTFGKKNASGATIMHAVVIRADGTEEDPSRLLGM